MLKKFAQEANINSLVLSVLRDAGCAPILLIAAYFVEGLHIPTWREMPFFALLGLFGMFLNQFLYIQGVYLTTANIASVYQPLIAVFTALLSISTLTEAFPDLKVV